MYHPVNLLDRYIVASKFRYGKVVIRHQGTVYFSLSAEQRTLPDISYPDRFPLHGSLPFFRNMLQVLDHLPVHPFRNE